MLVAQGLEHFDVVVVPHHGSLTSSTVPFVEALRPAVALVSAGYRNRWGFPEPTHFSAGAQSVRAPSRPATAAPSRSRSRREKLRMCTNFAASARATGAAESQPRCSRGAHRRDESC